MCFSDQIIHLRGHIRLVVPGKAAVQHSLGSCQAHDCADSCWWRNRTVRSCLRTAPSLATEDSAAGRGSAECARVLRERQSAWALGASGGHCCDPLRSELELQACRLDGAVQRSTWPVHLSCRGGRPQE